MIRSRCINSRTPTRLDRPRDEVEEDGEEEEDGFAVMEQPLEVPLGLVASLVTASSIGNVSHYRERNVATQTPR